MAAGDTALWLHNKLGSTDDLWSGKIICSQLSRERLINIQDCFHALQSHVKVKLLLSFLHIPKRNIEQWQQDLEEIVLLGIHDTDPWVATVGEIMREFPSTGALLLVEQDANTDSNMAACLEEIKLMVQKCNVSMMPLECQYLNKSSLAAVAGQIPEPSKHFTIKRRPKSAALRAEIIQKSSDTVLNKRNHSTSVPIKSRSFAKRMDANNSNITPLKMTPGRSPFSNSDFRSPGTTPMRMTPLGGRSPITPMSIASRSSSSKKDSKIKLLEIEEMPVGAKEAKRRKKIADMEAMEAQRKEKDALAAAAGSSQTGTTNSSTATTVSYTPDYAAGLMPSAPPKMPMTVLSVSNSALPQPSPAYLPSSARQNTQVSISNNLTSSLQPSVAPNLSEQLKQQLLQPQARTTTIPASPLSTMTPILITQQPSSINSPLQSVATISTNHTIAANPAVASPSPLIASPMVRPVVVQQIVRPSLSTQPQQVLTITQQPQQSTSQAPPAGPKTGLSLTKDQMLEAQEMFRVSNKVSRPEKALILGFMAGSRENPCAQRGNILNIKLSEKEEVVLLPDGTKKKKIEDTIFQMNYATGEWKRFLNLREVDVS